MEDTIKDILIKGDIKDRRLLFQMLPEHSTEVIYGKFSYFTRYFYPNFFKSKDAPFHKEMVCRLIELYKGHGISEFLLIGFRGCSKTTYTKLFLAYVLANDSLRQRKYIKVLSGDISNSRQIVTDIYNMLIKRSIIEHYPFLFKESEQKRQETMLVIDFATGVKVKAGSIGQAQRGNVQGSEEASRPDFLVLDDIETRDTLKSAVKSRSIWDNMQEAIDGLAKGGSTLYLANYISERGNVHRLVERIQNKMIIPIIENGKPTWDRYSLAEIESIKNKSDDFQGEYLCKPSATKDAFVAREEIEKQQILTPVRTSGGFKIYKDYTPSHRIAGGMDIALGVGLDSSASVFIDFTTLPFNVVATYHNNEIKPSNFGDEIARQGRMYGECLVAPEKNNAGVSTIDRLKQIYPMTNIYATRKSELKITDTKITELGWDTNGATKGLMLNDLAEAIENGWINLNDEDLIREAKSYTRGDLLEVVSDPRLATRHFDLLIACCIAYQMKDFAKVSNVIKRDPFAFNNTNKFNSGVDNSFE